MEVIISDDEALVSDLKILARLQPEEGKLTLVLTHCWTCGALTSNSRLCNDCDYLAERAFDQEHDDV